MRAGQQKILGAIGLVARPIRLDIHLVGDVELRLAVFEGPGISMRQVPVAQLGERLQRRGRPEAR